MEEDILFTALAHEARRRVVKALGDKGRLTFTEMMAAAGIDETGTFGFHLKKMEPLLEKEGAWYRLSELGRLAYRILKHIEEGEPLERAAPHEAGKPITLEGLDEVVVNRELLEEAPVEIVDCDVVIFAEDVDKQLFRERVLSISGADVVRVPRHLYPLVFTKIEGGVDTVDYYEEGEPHRVKEFTCFSSMVVDLKEVEGKVKIANFGVLKLKGLDQETLGKIDGIVNFGTLLVPKGYRDKVLSRLRLNAGAVQEYEEAQASQAPQEPPSQPPGQEPGQE